MPAARYWRAVGLQSVAGGALELSALHLYFGGVRVDATATLASTFAPTSGTLAVLQDGDTSTAARWEDVSAPGFALVWDFGVGNAQDVGGVRLGAGALYREWLETLTLQYSSDGVAWATAGSAAAFTWPGAKTLQAVPPDGDGSFSSVTLLLHCDGVSGSTTLVDSSAYKTPVTALGAAKITTAQSAFAGGASLDLSAGTYSAAQAPDNFSGLKFGTGDFTIEFHVLTVKAWQQVDYPRLVAAGQYATAGAWALVYLKPNGGSLYLDFYRDGAVVFGLGCGVLTDGVWHHVAITRAGTTVRAFLDGVLRGSGTSAADLNTPFGFTVGSESTGGGAFAGFFDEIRVTKGVSRYTASFTPPSGPFRDAAVGAVAAPPTLRAPSPERARIAASAPVPPHSTLSAPRLLTARNVEFAGTGTASATGTIYGSTAIKGTPNAPVRAKVSLLRARDLLLVQQTWSDPATGAYAFHGLDPAEKYTTLAEYPTGDRRAVAADQITPDIEEARAP